MSYSPVVFWSRKSQYLSPQKSNLFQLLYPKISSDWSRSWVYFKWYVAASILFLSLIPCPRNRVRRKSDNLVISLPSCRDARSKYKGNKQIYDWELQCISSTLQYIGETGNLNLVIRYHIRVLKPGLKVESVLNGIPSEMDIITSFSVYYCSLNSEVGLTTCEQSVIPKVSSVGWQICLDHTESHHDSSSQSTRIQKRFPDKI